MKAIAIGLLGLGSALAPARHMVAQAGVQTGNPPGPNVSQLGGKDLIQAVVQHETDASQHRGFYMYLSVEKSDRTNGHEWTERVAETQWGKIHYLIAEDGKPLNPQREAAERARIEDDAAHPDAFKQREMAKGQDEQHAREMMTLLPKAFIFDKPEPEGDFIRVHYRPNPDYQPNGMEEKVLHAMSGSVLVDPRHMRTRELEGKLPQDLSLGFGLLATIHAGSNFSTTRQHCEGPDWKTQNLHTDINGKALFLKTIARSEEAHHSEFKQIPSGITVADAVKLVEQQ